MPEKKLKIGIDLRPLLSGKVSGVENYILNLLEEMLEQDQENEYFLWVNAHRHFNFPKRLKRPNVECIQSRWPNKFLNLSLSFFGWLGMERFFPKKIDVMWVPDPRPVVLKNTPLITTFHDLSPEIYPQFFNLKTRIWHRLLNAKKLAQKSDKIIAVSEATKQDLLEKYGVDEGKVEVVYEAPAGEMKKANKEEIERVRAKYNLPERYVLTLSTLEPRKNLERLLLAFQVVQSILKTVPSLVVAGVTNEKIFAELPEFGNEKNVIFTGFVEEEDKAALYSGAEFFINLSLLEGFGLPVAEAVACETPCLVAENSALPEVAGEAGLRVDPLRVSAIASGMRELIRDTEKTAAMSKKARVQAKKFSWEKSAKQTLAILKKTAK